MKCYLNGNKLDLGPSNSSATLGEVVTLISREYVPLSRVIREIHVDGKLLNTEDERGMDQHSLDGADKLEIITADPADLAREGLQDALSYMDRLIPGVAEIASLFRDGDIQGAVKLYDMAVEGINWFASLVSMGEQYSAINYENEEFNGRTISGQYEELEKAAGDLARLMEGRNWTGIALLLEEILVPHFQAWKTMIPKMMAGIQKKPA